MSEYMDPAGRDKAMSDRKRALDRHYKAVLATGNKRAAEIVRHAGDEMFLRNNPYFFDALVRMNKLPVTIDEFLNSKEFLGDQIDIWPKLRQDILDINPDVFIGEPPVRQVLMGGATGCVDADTEYLSPAGWRRIADYDGGQVAQYHEGGRMSFVQPSEYVKRPCERFYHFRTKYGVDQCLSPEHRVYYQTTKGHTAIRSAFEVAAAHNTALRGWRGRFFTTFDYSGPGVALSDLQLRLQVAVMADGSLDPRGKRAYLQFRKVAKADRLRDLLRAAGVDFSERYDEATRYWRFSFVPPVFSKTYTPWDASKAQLAAMADEAMRWDARLGGSQFYSTSKAVADFVQFAFSATGRRASIGEDRREGKTLCYTVTVSNRTMVSMAGADSPRVEYAPASDGYKYCFEVPTSLLVLRRGGNIFVTGNTGKTESTRVTLAYQTYLLTCFDQPQRLYGLPPSTVIAGVFMSTQLGVTRRVLYQPFRSMFISMPYTRRWVEFDKKREAVLALAGNIEILPSLPDISNLVGQAINWALLDEVNFMLIVEQSKRAAGARGLGGKFDQADLTFRTVTRRRVSRFGNNNRVSIGCICAISSTRYKDDFLDRRIREVRENQKRFVEMDVRVFRHRQYDVQPDSNPENKTFTLLVGTQNYGTKVLPNDAREGRDYPQGGQIEDVPIKYLPDFLGDPDGSLRDIIGEASAAIAPYISQRHKIILAVERGKERGLTSWFDKQNVDLAEDGMPQVDEQGLPPIRERRMDWYVHIDLSKNKDRCGIAFVRLDGMQDVINLRTHAVETVPRFVVGAAVSIQPHITAEIDQSEIRMWVSLFKNHYGFNIKLVSYDGFGSTESIILFKKAGINSLVTSVDTTDEAYETFKTALYNDRLDMVENEILNQELANLERNEKTGKIDHPPNGSKDISDGVAGACWNASRDRSMRHEMAATTEYAGPPTPVRREGRRDIRRRDIVRR